MSVAHNLIAALGLAVLMVVHEGGHYLAARRYGMRVIRFSIGFGPTIWKHRPKGSPTVFQVAIIPFLAYVQIAGMNPYEEQDPKDTGSYANAPLWGRIVTIAAGPLANYFFASVLMFIGFLIAGRTDVDDQSMHITVMQESPAAAAGMRDNDKIVAVNGEAIHNWDELRQAVGKHAGEPIDVTIERDGQTEIKHPTVAAKGEKSKSGDSIEGKILIGTPVRVTKIGVGQAALLSVTEPPKVVYELVKGLGLWITGKTKAELSGPVGIVRTVGGAVERGAGDTFKLLGMLSAYLGGFNLLPIPALDGGRLLFLLFEATSRRKPDAKIEARIHAVGLLLMLGLIAFVTYSEIMPKH
ncbi:M50 family metallopeptidase [Pendulispora albinea]|uniref:M50 family metallopeptidase n=1 Tax=Pendulispora albinea TaxID=2741071 RepID=A0ABZ2LUM3_9BACT